MNVVRLVALMERLSHPVHLRFPSDVTLLDFILQSLFWSLHRINNREMCKWFIHLRLVTVCLMNSGRAGWIIRLNCWGGDFVFSAGKSGLFSPREGLIGSGPEVCSVVVWASSKPRSVLSSEECPLPRGRMCLSELLGSCRAAAARYLVSCHMAAARAGCWESAVSPCCVFDGDYRGEHDDTFLCGPLSCRGSTAADAECCIFLFFWAEKGYASIFNVLQSKFTAAMSAAWLVHSFLLA